MAVFLKYVVLSMLTAWACWYTEWKVARFILGIASIQLVGFALMFYVKQGETILNKSISTGKIPAWSFIAFSPFFMSNYLYMYIKKYTTRRSVPVAHEILENYWIGGWFVFELDRKWHAIVDLTNEFPEHAECTHYLNIPVWDGNPPTKEQLDTTSAFINQHAKNGPVLVHCAFGVGRSTTVLCAALVAAQEVNDFEEGLKMIKAKRKIVRLNSKMRKVLIRWERDFKKK